MVVPSTLLFLGVNLLFAVPLAVGASIALLGTRKVAETSKRRMTIAGTIVCILAAIGPFVLAAYLNRSGEPVRIVVPTDWTGEFAIVRDRKCGTELKFVDVAWEFRIPPSGELVVFDDHPFYRWHKETVVDADGRPVPAKGLGTTAGNIQSASGGWRGSTEYDGTTHRWTVEPRDAAVRYQTSWDG